MVMHGAAIGGGLHVGLNAGVNWLLKSQQGRRISGSLFNTGVRHAKAGKMIHPAINHVANAVVGPELHGIYEAGRKLGKTNVISRSDRTGGTMAINTSDLRIPKKMENKTARGIFGRLPSVSDTRKGKWTDYLAAGGLTAATALHNPVHAIGVMGWNAARTVIGHSEIGNRVLRNQFNKGVTSGPGNKAIRVASDYIASPSLGVARDAGHYAGTAYREAVAGNYQRVSAPDKKTVHGGFYHDIKRSSGRASDPLSDGRITYTDRFGQSRSPKSLIELLGRVPGRVQAQS